MENNSGNKEERTQELMQKQMQSMTKLLHAMNPPPASRLAATEAVGARQRPAGGGGKTLV